MSYSETRDHFFDYSLGGVVATFAGFLRFEEFTGICQGVLDLVRQTHTSKILVNTRLLKVMTQENQEWINAVWFPEAVQAGVRHMAFLVPEDLFGRMSMEATNKQASTDGIIQIVYFGDETQARSWLLEQ